jgi:hypothetical protein
MSGIRKSLRKGKMKKESRSMSQPNGLNEPNGQGVVQTQEKSQKKSFTWYLQPWKWKTQKSRPQLTLEIEPERRNSEPTTPTNAPNNPGENKAVNGLIHETAPAEDMIHHHPIIPKLRDISKTPQGQDMTQINDELTKAFKKFNLPETGQEVPRRNPEPRRWPRTRDPQEELPPSTYDRGDGGGWTQNSSNTIGSNKSTSTSKTSFATSKDIKNLYTPAQRPKGEKSSNLQKNRKNKKSESDDAAAQFAKSVAAINEKLQAGDQAYYDSEDDSPIQYLEEAEDKSDGQPEVDDLARKIARRDTIAREKEINELKLKANNKDMQSRKNDIEKALSRRLSQRPSLEELKARNICRNKSEKQEKEEREKIKKELSRRLSQRPNVEVLKKKKILKFEEYVDVYEVTNYERKAEKPWTKLTPEDKASIRKELNEFKANEMEVHKDSKHYTRFHRP